MPATLSQGPSPPNFKHVKVFKLEGSLTKEDYPAIAELVESQAEGLQVLADLSALDHIDRGGALHLLAASTNIFGNGGQFKVIGLGRSVHRYLASSHQLPLFDIYADERAAFTAFSSPPLKRKIYEQRLHPGY